MAVGEERDVEHDAVVARIGVVPVFDPLAGGPVHFDVAAPREAADPEAGGREVRPGVGVVKAGVQNLDRVARRRAEGGDVEPAAAPYVLDDGLGDVADAGVGLVERDADGVRAEVVVAEGRRSGGRRSEHGGGIGDDPLDTEPHPV